MSEPFLIRLQKRVMNPIRFSCEEKLPGKPFEIAGQILDLSRWSEFKGHGVIPGIQSAKFEKHTDDIVGTRIHVLSTDGSTYVEEISRWNPEKQVVIV